MASLATFRVARLRNASSRAAGPPSTHLRRSASSAKASAGALLVVPWTAELYDATHLARAALSSSRPPSASGGSVERKRMRTVRFQRSILPLAAPSRTAAWSSTIPSPPHMSESWSFL